ncbi:MAG: radical SAM protein [Deltaproteobacteria bacterium]|nr:radical SAM protein [Deltaproteobacteria bacterium]
MQIASHKLLESGELQSRAQKAQQFLARCELCPRLCRVNRRDGELGFCATGKWARVASYGAHFGEEQPLVGTRGSGTIFLASCNLRCCFCQNYDISHFPEDSPEVDNQTLAAIMLELQRQGCHNINFVTPSHVVPQILAALIIALEDGLQVPLVYNCSGYECSATLELLSGIIDIYMPDFKFWSSLSAEKYADAADYPEIARQALSIMHKQVGDLVTHADGLASKGLLIRHLLMPDGLNETREILRFISHDLSPASYVNIMDQYRPCGASNKHPELERSVSTREYQEALRLAHQAGLSRLDHRDLAVLFKNLGIHQRKKQL